MEEPINVEVQEIPSRIRGFFNPDTQITKLPEGKYKVETTLKDGIAEGGQKIELVIADEAPIEELKNVPGVELEKAVAWKVEKMIVNGGILLRSDQKLYFVNVPEDPGDKFNKEMPASSSSTLPPLPKGMEDLPPDFIGEHVVIDSEAFGIRIALSTILKTGDHLAAMLHEFGHLERNAEGTSNVRAHLGTMTTERQHKDWISSRDSFSRFFKPDAMEKKADPSFKEEQYFLSVLHEERRASTNAIRKIKEMRTQGHDFFPGDSDLWRVKKCLTTTLMTYLQGDKDLQRVIGGRANRILDLN